MEFKWYIIHAYAGSENKVVQTLKEQAEKKNLADCFEEIVVPTEEVLQYKNGTKISVDKKYLPGYILLKMKLTDDAWTLVRTIPRVSGFLGVKGKPTVVSEAEVKRIMEQIRESAANPKTSICFEVGDNVKVCEGPFASFSGLVEETEPEKQKLKVSVMVLGRATPLSLDYSQVEKI
jgi:transcriptional antiterminator NusG